MSYEFTTLGAIVGLVIAITLIIKKVQPAYSLIFGALIGGVIGGGHRDEKVLPSFCSAMIGPAVVIILLALRPIFNITIDPLIALPIGGLVL